MGGTKKNQFLKVLGAKKKTKKGCYLIKEAAINLSGSSAAPLHIWLLNSGHSLPILLAQPGWDLWFLLLVSHAAWSRFPLSTLSRRLPAGPAGGDCGRGPSSVPGLHFFLGQGVKRLLTWKRLRRQHAARQEEAGAPRVLLAPALEAALV